MTCDQETSSSIPLPSNSNPNSTSKPFPFPPPIDLDWKYVEEFPEITDHNDEWEEEVEYLTLDLGPLLDRRNFSPDVNFQLLGLNTPKPFLKIAGQLFQGTHEHLIGTELIMEESRRISTTQPSYDPLVSLTSRLRFRPITLDPLSTTQDLSPETVTMRHWASRSFKPRAKRNKPAQPPAQPPTGAEDGSTHLLVVAAEAATDEDAEDQPAALVSDVTRALSSNPNTDPHQSEPSLVEPVTSHSQS